MKPEIKWATANIRFGNMAGQRIYSQLFVLYCAFVRSNFTYDKTRSGALTKKYGKNTYAFVISNQTSSIPEKDSQLK